MLEAADEGPPPCTNSSSLNPWLLFICRDEGDRCACSKFNKMLFMVFSACLDVPKCKPCHVLTWPKSIQLLLSSHDECRKWISGRLCCLYYCLFPVFYFSLARRGSGWCWRVFSGHGKTMRVSMSLVINCAEKTKWIKKWTWTKRRVWSLRSWQYSGFHI